MFVDIHTHIDNQSVIKIVYENGVRIFETAGIHPWEVVCHFDWSEAEWRNPFFEKAFGNGGFLDKLGMTAAIGEVGLDKAHKDTFDKQIEVFEGMIRLSESYRKPMIIHCVRAYSEIIAMRKTTKATMPWVIHGFNSSVETMRQLLKHDMYISLGEMLYRNESQAVEILNDIPLERLFLETDVSGRDIKDVYSKAARLMNCEVDLLCKQIFENYERLETAH